MASLMFIYFNINCTLEDPAHSVCTGNAGWIMEGKYHDSLGMI